MKSKILLLSLALCCSVYMLEAANDPLLFSKEEKQHLAVNNRILAKVNGKAISVVDVMKKMDVLFYREFPEYTSSTQARYQFYKVNWKHVLDELVSKELVMADAEENKLPVSNGDVRQEMENIFGPNIIENLDKIGLTYEEAQKIVLGDITIRRMIYLRVNSKALKKVTPQVIRAAYDEYAKNPANIKPDMWHYHVISVRDDDPTRGAEAANLIHQLLNEKVSLDQLNEEVKKMVTFNSTQISVSEEYSLPEKDISDNYKSILTKMTPHSHSLPIIQKSRANRTNIFRIFVLKNVEKGGVDSFIALEPNIKNKLLDIAVNEETELYLKKLRKHFHVQEFYSTKNDDQTFEPFSLK